MNLRLLALCTALALSVTASRADDVAVLHFRTGGQVKRLVIEFYPESAPITVANFKKLAKTKFYNGTAIHRAFPHQMVQMGDPLSKAQKNTGVGTGGPGYTLPPEIGRKHTAGAVAAARLPDKINPARRSNGSQFYISLQPAPNLDGQYTVFGRVVDGMETLDALSQGQTDTNDAPVQRIELESVKILPREVAAQGDAQPTRVGKFLRHLF